LRRPQTGFGAKFFRCGESADATADAQSNLRTHARRTVQMRDIDASCDMPETRISSAFLVCAIFFARIAVAEESRAAYVSRVRVAGAVGLPRRGPYTQN